MNKETFNKRIAEDLVKCGYAEEYRFLGGKGNDILLSWEISGGDYPIDEEQLLKPFSDTLEGRRQADALEGYLRWHEKELWGQSWLETAKQYMSIIDSTICKVHQWRLDRIKYCYQQLESKE